MRYRKLVLFAVLMLPGACLGDMTSPSPSPCESINPVACPFDGAGCVVPGPIPAVASFSSQCPQAGDIQGWGVMLDKWIAIFIAVIAWLFSQL